MDARTLQDLPDEVKDCEKSVRESNPSMDKSTAIAICRDQLNMQDAPETGNSRLAVFTPTGSEATEEILSSAQETTAQETDTEVTLTAEDDGVLIEAAGEEIPHAALDTVESALQSELGDGSSDDLAKRKSLLMTAGEDQSLTVQPCFELETQFSEAMMDEAARLIAFVGGVETVPYHNENRLYFDTKDQSLHHTVLDVSEIVTRRIAADNDIEIESHSIKLLDEQPDDPEIELASAPTSVSAIEAVKSNLKKLEEDPCQDGWVMVGTKQKDGQTVPNCVPEEDADPANLSHGRQILGGTRQLADRIERTEQDDGTVLYEGIKALTEGVWTDQNSKESVHYIPSNLDVELGAEVNVMHDQSDVSESGEIVDFEHGTDSNGKEALFVDFELDTNSEAGAYADKALKTALESGGKEGFGGPSVEIPANHEIEPNGPKGHPTITDGKIAGLGLVGQPAAKDTAFEFQANQRAVALGSQDALILEREQRNMADAEELRETLESAGINTEDMEDEDVMDMAESLHDDLMSELDMAEHGGDEDEDEDEEDDTEMADDGAVDSLEEQIDDIWGEMDEIKAMIEDMQDQMATEEEMSAAQEELSENIEEAREELAEAETVQELAEAKDELDKRLSNLEEQPDNEGRTLSDEADLTSIETPSGPF